jgi:hypothetical protein
VKKREGLLLENKILLATVYIDPMNQILLSEDQIAKAKEALCDVAVRMKGLLCEKSEDSEPKDEDVSSKSFSSS